MFERQYYFAVFVAAFRCLFVTGEAEEGAVPVYVDEVAPVYVELEGFEEKGEGQSEMVHRGGGGGEWVLGFSLYRFKSSMDKKKMCAHCLLRNIFQDISRWYRE